MTRRRFGIAFAAVLAILAAVGLVRRERLRRSRRIANPRSYTAADSLLDDSYLTLPSLDEARSLDHTAVVMQGADRAQVYLTVPVKYVACAEGALRGLLVAIDALEWNDAAHASLTYQLAPIGSGIFGELGGGSVIDGVWVHPRLEAAGIRPLAAAVVYGRGTLDELLHEFPNALPPGFGDGR